MSVPKAARSFAVYLAIGLYVCIVGAFVILDVSLLTERPTATREAAAHGQPGLSVTDPTAGTYDNSAELALLASADPTGAAYLHSHPVTITPLHDDTFKKFFAGVSDNPVGTDAIVLRQDKLRTPELWAIALSHELVHVQHGDPNTPLGQHSFLHHLWMTEEGEAHLRGLQTARALHAPTIGSSWQDNIFNIYPLPITYVLLIVTAVCVCSTRRLRRQSPCEHAFRSLISHPGH